MADQEEPTPTEAIEGNEPPAQSAAVAAQMNHQGSEAEGQGGPLPTTEPYPETPILPPAPQPAQGGTSDTTPEHLKAERERLQRLMFVSDLDPLDEQLQMQQDTEMDAGHRPASPEEEPPHPGLGTAVFYHDADSDADMLAIVTTAAGDVGVAVFNPAGHMMFLRGVTAGDGPRQYRHMD